MIPEAFRRELVELIEEAHSNGARYRKACEVAEISLRSLQRWKKEGLKDKRKFSHKRVVRKISPETRQDIFELCNSPRFRDLSPHQIVPLMLNEDRYLASESTFYRILKAHGMLHHRSNTRVKKKQSRPPERRADRSNQVWCWDITWLPQVILGFFFYAYVIIDIFDKSIVGWSIHDKESESHSRELFERVSLGQNIRFENLHSDNGGPMKGISLMALLSELKVEVSFSRPRVSNDNPFIESLFRTLKYHSTYPIRFKDIESARLWMADFVSWYNTQHLHSSIGYVTPHQMRTGESYDIFWKRNNVMAKAKVENPERWGSREIKIWKSPEIVYLNPKIMQ